jgi:hypothetical protein
MVYWSETRSAEMWDVNGVGMSVLSMVQWTADKMDQKMVGLRAKSSAGSLDDWMESRSVDGKERR